MFARVAVGLSYCVAPMRNKGTQLLAPQHVAWLYGEVCPTLAPGPLFDVSSPGATFRLSSPGATFREEEEDPAEFLDPRLCRYQQGR